MLGLPAVALCIIVVLAYYAACFALQTHKKGLDPALLTHAGPLTWRGHSLLIYSSLLVIVVDLYTSTSHLFTLGVCMYIGAHILLLSIFERAPTQPFWAYICAALLCFNTFFEYPYSHAVTTFLTALGLWYFVRWQKQKKVLYNSWVKKSALKIHHRFWPEHQDSSELVWYCVLLIATTESIARPRASRLLEKCYFMTKRPAMMSSGIMQVMSAHYLTDNQSIAKGKKLIESIVAAMPHSVETDQQKIAYLSKAYNGSYSYQAYVHAVYPGFQAAWHQLKHDGVFRA